MNQFLNDFFRDGEVFIVTTLVLFVGAIILIRVLVKSLTALRRPAPKSELSEEEGDLLQKIWDQQQKMEDRIMNLETILLDRSREREHEKRY
jgi:hypothetical protein